MGFLDNLFGKSEPNLVAAKGSPFAVSTSFRPMRMTGRSSSSVDLLLAMQNVSDAPQICSVVIELPKSLGFDPVGLHKTKELRLGAIDPKVRKAVDDLRKLSSYMKILGSYPIGDGV